MATSPVITRPASRASAGVRPAASRPRMRRGGLTFGSLSDRFGRKGMLMAGLAVFGGARSELVPSSAPVQHITSVTRVAA